MSLRALAVVGLAGAALIGLHPDASVGSLGALPAMAGEHGVGNGASGDHAAAQASADHGPASVASNAGSNNGQSANAPGHNKASADTNVASLAPNADLGALHAVNANLQAYIHANPKSRVGKMAVYAKALIVVENDTTAVNNATTAFDDTLALFEAAYTAGYADYDIATLQARYDELAALGAAATAEQMNEMTALQAVLQSYDVLQAAQQTLATDQGLADAALDDAANKPVTSDVKDYVQAALETGGILEYYRSQ